MIKKVLTINKRNHDKKTNKMTMPKKKRKEGNGNAFIKKNEKN
jgi:hypothetical protein